MRYRYGRGDSGYTDLMGGGRVRKDHPRVEAYGSIDELSSLLGVAKTFVRDEEIKHVLKQVQEHLFIIGAILSAEKPPPNIPRVDENTVRWMDRLIERYEEELPPLNRFIIAGGTRGAALLHLARTVARRAERRVVSLAEKSQVDNSIIAYMNRLSTLLFTLARLENHRAGVEEEEWRGSY